MLADVHHTDQVRPTQDRTKLCASFAGRRKGNIADRRIIQPSWPGACMDFSPPKNFSMLEHLPNHEVRKIHTKSFQTPPENDLKRRLWIFVNVWKTTDRWTRREEWCEIDMKMTTWTWTEWWKMTKWKNETNWKSETWINEWGWKSWKNVKYHEQLTLIWTLLQFIATANAVYGGRQPHSPPKPQANPTKVQKCVKWKPNLVPFSGTCLSLHKTIYRIGERGLRSSPTWMNENK